MFFYTNRRKYNFVKKFDFQFLINKHALRYSELNFSIFRKFLSVYLSICPFFCLCARDKNFVTSTTPKIN